LQVGVDGVIVFFTYGDGAVVAGWFDEIGDVLEVG
jgi:hypothetical protein